MSWKKWTVSVWTMFFFILLADPAMANPGENHTLNLSSGKMEASAFLAMSEIDYEDDDNDKLSIERKIIGLSLSRGITDKFNIFSSVGYLWDGNLDPENLTGELDLDQGYYLSAGARYKAYQSGQLSGHFYGKVDYTVNETHKGDRIIRLQNGFGQIRDFNAHYESEISGYEVTLGGVVNYKINDQFNAYAGISFVPLMSLTSDQKVEATSLGIEPIRIDEDIDIERDNQLGIKFGGQYHINQTLTINAEANFGTDKSYVVNIGKKF